MENADAARVSTLTVREEIPTDGEWLQYVIAVDGQPLEALLNRDTASGGFNGLYPSLGMNDSADQRLAAELVAKRAGWTPLLVCGDDMDLSCSVVSAYVQEMDDWVWWSRFGWGVDGGREIAAPARCFAKADYDRFVDDYLRFAARPLFVENSGPEAGPGMELDTPSRRITSMDFVVNLVAWVAFAALLVFVFRYLWG